MTLKPQFHAVFLFSTNVFYLGYTSFDMGYTVTYSRKLKADLKKVSKLVASDFLLKRGYSASSFTMPEYYRASGFSSIKLNKIKWIKKSFPNITKTLDVLTPKSHLSWRSFNFIHPYIFLQIVEQITEGRNWNLIKKHLTSDTFVSSYSTPIFSTKPRESISAKNILNWLQMAEKDLIKDCVEFNFLTVTDIKDFYPTIYTHSISWALHGKKKAKKERFNFQLLGNRLDKLVQNAQDAQTNGIPVGSAVSDLIAELILVDIDKKLSKELVREKITNRVLVARYRDDYRILSKTAEEGKKVLLHLNKIIRFEYGLSLNPNKTQSYDDIIEGSFKSWKMEIKNSHLLRKINYGDISECVDGNYLKDCLIETYRIQKRFPEGRASVSILTKLTEKLSTQLEKFIPSEIPEIVSLLRKITLLREEVTPQAFLLMDILLTKIKTKNEKKRILTGIAKVIVGKPDQEYQLIWFYRLCLSHCPSMCPDILRRNKKPLLRLVDRKRYKHDYQVFETITPFTSADQKELEKFSFINRKKLIKARNTPINPNSLNPFKY